MKGMVMKTNKALKRLAKIEALMSDVTERYSVSAAHIREVLQDAKAAVTRAKEAVSLQASSGTAKYPPVEHSEPTSRATPESSKTKRELSATGRKAIIAATKKRWAAFHAAKQAETPEPAVSKRPSQKRPLGRRRLVRLRPRLPSRMRHQRNPPRQRRRKLRSRRLRRSRLR